MRIVFAIVRSMQTFQAAALLIVIWEVLERIRERRPAALAARTEGA